MSIDNKSQQQARRSARRRDDLTIIRGIAEAMEQWFRQSFKVATYADLAALSCAEIEGRAREQGQILSRSKIEQILAQAAVLAGDGRGQESTTAPPLRSPRVDHRAASARENGWHELAQFMVYVESKAKSGDEDSCADTRTSIHHIETGEHECWPGVGLEQAREWMRRRIDPRSYREVASRVAATSTPARPDRPASGHDVPGWTITRIRLLRMQPERATTIFERNECRPALVAAHCPFVVEITIEAQDDIVARAGPDVTFGVCLRAHNRDTGAVVDLGRGNLRTPQPNANPAIICLQLMAPVAGSFRLECIPMVDGIEIPSQALRLPLLQAIAGTGKVATPMAFIERPAADTHPEIEMKVRRSVDRHH